MENKILGWFFILGIALLGFGLFFPEKTNSAPSAAAAKTSQIEEIGKGVLSWIEEIKTSSATSNPVPSSDTKEPDPNEIFNEAYKANERGDYLLSIEEYSKYLILVPGDASGYYNRGLANYTLKRYDEAVKDFNKAVEIDPNKTSAFLYKGYGNEMIDDCKQAIQDFQKAISLGENKNAELYGHKARCENHYEDYSEALDDARKAVNLDKKNAYAFFELAYAQYGLRKYSESALSYTKVLQFNPNDEVAFHNRGLAYVFLKKTPSACKDFQKSLELGYADSKNRLNEYCK
ncbi:tetratricopeptide repeat protein [Leptospira weilii serovar Ranarum str. ICFT]|uniref:Tetratricopeptide repeat protein n=1 Tax=Leptospira weilii serovar Ranarum str. ICFT TaxID=1218598 RepID=N1WD02_9LEPT|nr:tetratricopeptide repeat protein [Leptospira weilii]EMY78136.1 tetratricopeptide repeat protein [Leptospira weilii serovar Ranarum str. ICFT]